jgi:hypothetical protein
MSTDAAGRSQTGTAHRSRSDYVLDGAEEIHNAVSRPAFRWVLYRRAEYAAVHPVDSRSATTWRLPVLSRTDRRVH